MRNIFFLLAGIYFGIVLVKSEVISWFRIQEMFRFQSFHMYGVIGVAVVFGIISVLVIKKMNWKTVNHEAVNFNKGPLTKGHVAGGIIFGLGWAMTGACPGPLYALIGSGYVIIIPVLLSAILGAFTYGVLRDKMPH